MGLLSALHRDALQKRARARLTRAGALMANLRPSVHQSILPDHVPTWTAAASE